MIRNRKNKRCPSAVRYDLGGSVLTCGLPRYHTAAHRCSVCRWIGDEGWTIDGIPFKALPVEGPVMLAPLPPWTIRSRWKDVPKFTHVGKYVSDEETMDRARRMFADPEWRARSAKLRAEALVEWGEAGSAP